jgi:GNAT superfamily N-acetyltransferase
VQEDSLLDELMANAWRPKVVETYGGWRYRWADGVTRRANSALAVRADARVGELVDRATAFYGQRGAPTLIQVSTMSAPQSLIAYLHAHGYRSTARTLVESAATQDVIEGTRPTLEIEITQTPTEEWFRTYWAVESTRGRSDSDMAVCRDILLDPGLPTAFAAVRYGSEVTGVGQLVIERGWGGVQCMATDPAQRRRGVANAVLNGLANEARQRGTERMYLAVMAENAAATALYERAGFRAVHEYSYFTDHPD